MKTIKEIKKLAEKIEAFEEVSKVAILSDRLIITQKDNDDRLFYHNSKKLEKKITELTGQIPTPCDVYYREWFIYLDEVVNMKQKYIIEIHKIEEYVICVEDNELITGINNVLEGNVTISRTRQKVEIIEV